MLWQMAYTELVFLPVHWPDFDQNHLSEAIAEFRRRERRYGASSG
jgi:undecaprenyl diphosphate synthase